MFSPPVAMDTTTKLHSDLRLRQNEVKLNNTIAINVYHEGNNSNVWFDKVLCEDDAVWFDKVFCEDDAVWFDKVLCEDDRGFSETEAVSPESDYFWSET